MIRINSNFTELPETYLFTEIARRVSDFEHRTKGEPVIRMGIGDVTRPLCAAAVKALKRAAEDEAHSLSFQGYGPEQGYRWLRESIAETDYRRLGININPDEIFISDGAKSDLGNLTEIFAADVRVAVTDPVYPVYVDTTVMAGRAGTLTPDGHWSRIIYLPCTEDNRFVPELPGKRPDLIYLCYPNNPTGTTLTRGQLREWVDYAARQGSLILYDSAYESFITDPEVPHSIYEIDGAEEVAIEVRSFSKTAGFTGLRCGYTVIPFALRGVGADGSEVSLHRLWNRRQCTKFNGASYLSQCAAEAVLTPEGRRQTGRNISFYLNNARILRQGLTDAGLTVYGGVNAPYLWVKTPGGLSSWEFFDEMMRRCRVVCTPGVGFGPCGEGFVRFTAFGGREATAEAAERIIRAGF